MEQMRAVLVGYNYNSLLGLARSLGSNGFEVFVIRTGAAKGKNHLRNLANMPESNSKYIARYVTASAQTDDPVIDILLRQFKPNAGKAFLFPVDDRSAEIIDLNYVRLEPFYCLPNVNHQPGAVIALMDKLYQKQLAKSVGLSVPEGWSVTIKNGVYQLPESIPFPCFIKAEVPFPNRKNFMRRCDNENELRDALDKAAAFRDCVMLIEEYVEIEREYGTVGMCNRGDVCIPGITEKIVVGHGSQAGVTVIGKIHTPSEYEDVHNKLKALMEKTGFQGLFDIDLYESNGKMYFNELNVRIGGAGVGTLLAGVELPRMLVDSFREAEQGNDYDAVAKTITFVNERPLLSEYREGYITWKEYKEYINSSKYRFIFDKEDMGPYYSYSVAVFIERLRKVKKRMKAF